MDTNDACVCAAGYYQTAAGNTDNPPTCAQPAQLEAQPMETPNSQSISTCGKNARILIDWY